jgi:hypothetical protein
MSNMLKSDKTVYYEGRRSIILDKAQREITYDTIPCKGCSGKGLLWFSNDAFGTYSYPCLYCNETGEQPLLVIHRCNTCTGMVRKDITHDLSLLHEVQLDIRNNYSIGKCHTCNGIGKVCVYYVPKL